VESFVVFIELKGKTAENISTIILRKLEEAELIFKIVDRKHITMLQ